MARHGIFIGNQKIVARYVGNRLVWKVQAQSSSNLVWQAQVNGLAFVKSSNQLSLFLKSSVDFALSKIRFLEVNGAVFEVTQPGFSGGFGTFNLKKRAIENLSIAKSGKPSYETDERVTWIEPVIKLYDTLDAQPVTPEPKPQPVPEPEKPSTGTVVFEGSIRRIMAFKNTNFLDFYFYHDNQISNTAYKSVEINGVLFPIKNIRSYGTSVIGVNGEGNFTSKKDDLTKAGFPLNDNYRQVDNPKIKLYK